MRFQEQNVNNCLLRILQYERAFPRMNSRICICCGEPMAPGNFHSRYAHICASCASFLDGEDADPSSRESSVANVEQSEQETRATEAEDYVRRVDKEIKTP